jgi:cytochrome c oxidase subunit 2
MSAATVAEAGPVRSDEPRHALRIVIIWGVLAAIFTPIVYFVWGPHMPPGRMTDAAASQQWDNTVLGAFATPVVLFVWVWFGYAIVNFRQRGDVLEDGVPITGSKKLAVAWVLTTSAIVAFAFGFGTYELVIPNGAGGGEGPHPIWKPGSHRMLQVQVIAQQWRFTYRFPQFGGVETTTLELPVHTQVQFNVTSLDVIHDFWAIELGVKADANPGVNNVAYAKALQTGPFTVRCDELCGEWHGAMYNSGKVVSPASFMSWITTEERANAAVTKLLPPYAPVYNPSKTGAGGSYYIPDTIPHDPGYSD